MGRSLRANGTLDIAGRPAAWLREGALDGRPVVALAHGAGAALDSAFLEDAARDLVDGGVCVVRFHFPYMQQRVDTGSRRPPDRSPVLLDCWRALLDRIAGMRGAGPVVMAGKSMGARMASMLLAEGRAPEVRGAVYFGYPLHPSGKPERLRSEHLPDVPVPQLFVTGTRDALAELPLLRRALKPVEGARLLVVEGGDHSLARRKKDEVLGPAVDWMAGSLAFIHEVC